MKIEYAINSVLGASHLVDPYQFIFDSTFEDIYQSLPIQKLFDLFSVLVIVWGYWSVEPLYFSSPFAISCLSQLSLCQPGYLILLSALEVEKL